MEEEKKGTVVLYPGVGVGHLAPMLELARELLRHACSVLDVAVALVEPPISDPAFPGAVERARATHTSVAFHVLPPPTNEDWKLEDEHPMARRINFLTAMNASLHDFLVRTLPPVRALVLDLFCGDALDVAAELDVPAYFFFSSSAASLAILLGLPARRAALGDAGFVAALGRHAALTFPGAPPFRVSDLPTEMTEDGAAARAMFRMGARLPEAQGILVNTFEAFERYPVRALRDGICVPGGGSTPPVYCAGPLVSPGGKERHDCLRWMDGQPDRSVVFLCFGSLGAFPAHQLQQIAVGLEKSGQRFLWVVRDPSGELDVDAVLPAGFRERTKDRGLVLDSWAPQSDVLWHRATGAFVTHCGWNSVLEGVAAGLPMLCWPLYAEQRLNKIWVVDEMKLGVAMVKRTSSCTNGDKDDDDDELVSAEEVEGKVRWVMASEDEGARELRERVATVRDAAADALAEGGSSHADFVKFINDMEKPGTALLMQ